MTVKEFKDKHGAAFKMFTRTACYVAFLQTLKDAHPLKKLKDKTDGEKLNGSALWLAQIDGYEGCLDTIAKTAELDIPEPADVPSNYPPPE